MPHPHPVRPLVPLAIRRRKEPHGALGARVVPFLQMHGTDVQLQIIMINENPSANITSDLLFFGSMLFDLVFLQ